MAICQNPKCNKEHSRTYRPNSKKPAKYCSKKCTQACVCDRWRKNNKEKFKQLQREHRKEYTRIKLGLPLDHPRLKAIKGSGCIKSGYKVLTINKKAIFEHRFVMEKMLGRPLKNTETVHHIDGNKINNNPSNLELRVGAHGPGQRVEDIKRIALQYFQEEGYELVKRENGSKADRYLLAI